MKNIIILTLCFLIFFNVVFGQDSVMVAKYTFNKGDARDESGNNHIGMISGASLTEDRFGNSNYAFHFDGIDDYIDCDSIMNFPYTTALTISAWFKVESIDSSNSYVGIAIGKKTTGLIALRVMAQNNMGFQSIMADALESNASNMKSDSMIFNNWVHLVGVFNDNEVKIYVNGILQNITNNKGSGGKFSQIPSSSKLRIGLEFVDFDEKTYFKGSIDDIYIYNKSLTVQEITTLFNQPNPVSSGLTELKFSTFSLFPNPTDNLITITLPSFDRTNIVIYNNMGIIVRKSRTNNSTINLSTSDLAHGIYYIQLLQNNTPMGIKKFVKN